MDYVNHPCHYDTGKEDVKKAQWNLNEYIELSEKEGAKHD